MNYLKQIEGLIIKGNYWESHKQVLGLIDSFVTIDNKLDCEGGVYQIENFYVGRSVNFKQRLASHILEMVGTCNAKIHPNKYKMYEMQRVLCDRKLKITILDSDAEREPEYIKELYSKLPLVNVEFVSDGMRESKRLQYAELLRGEKVTFEITMFNNKYVVCRAVLKGTNIYRIAESVTRAKAELEKYINLKATKNKSKKSGKGEEFNIELYNYVAVKKGRMPGLYRQNENWREQILGFKFAEFKGFNNAEEGREYLRTIPVKQKKSKLSRKEKRDKKRNS